MKDTVCARLLAEARIPFQTDDITFGLSSGRLSHLSAVAAAFMRVAGDLIEDGIDLNITTLMKLNTVAYYDEEMKAAAFLLIREDAVIKFAWTHPAYRRLGLFSQLIKIVARTHYGMRIRVDPPILEEGFAAATKKLGFMPVSHLAEYRPSAIWVPIQTI